MAEVQQVNEALNSAMTGDESKAGRYLTFRLAAEEYGLEILRVREIIGLMQITNVPRTPHYIRGVINLRGKVIPVLELRSKFGMETKDDTKETCIIVVEMTTEDGSLEMGILVDAVCEVLNIPGVDIENAPSFGCSADTDFILGMGKINNEVKILLDIDKVLTAGEMNMAEEIGQAPATATNSDAKEEVAEVV